MAATGTGTVVICLKLSGCREVVRQFSSPVVMQQYFNDARRIMPDLLEQATNDFATNIAVREHARSMLREHQPPDDQFATKMTALFFWLVLHDCQKGSTLRQALRDSLEAHGVAVFTIGCSERGAYVTAVADAIVDIDIDIKYADRMTTNSQSTMVH